MQASPWRIRPSLWVALAVYVVVAGAGSYVLSLVMEDAARAVSLTVPAVMFTYLTLAMMTVREGWSWFKRFGFVGMAMAGGATMTLVLGLVLLPLFGISPLVSIAIGALFGSLPWVMLGLWESTLFVEPVRSPLFE